MPIKENVATLKYFQEKIKKGEKSVTVNELEKFGIDKSKTVHQFQNIVLKKDFFGDWMIKIVDDQLDLNCKPISQNKKLITRLKALWENGSRDIKFSELIDLDIVTPAASIQIQNFKLTDNSILFSTGRYDITLADKNKNIDALWLDNMINTERVLSVLKEFALTDSELHSLSEIDLNKQLETLFKKHFENVKKGGTTDRGLVDLILGDMKYGIELKLARELKKTAQADRAIGQIDRYMEKFGANFMIVIAGTEEQKKEKTIQDLIKKIRNSKGTYYYLETHN